MLIGELADRGGVTPKTIRYYESIGLLADPPRTPSGYRDYDTGALERLSFIREAQGTGLTLAEIQSVLELKDAGAGSCEHTRSLLQRHLEELDAQIERLREARGELAELAARAAALDPTTCSDPNRCQVIGATRGGVGDVTP